MASATVTAVVIAVVLKAIGRSTDIYRVCASFGPPDLRLWADRGGQGP